MIRAALAVCLFFTSLESALAQGLKENQLSFANFKSLIEKGTIRSPDDLMSVLPPTMLSRYALNFSSRSPLKKFVTAEAPRILMVGEQGFAMALNTLPDEGGKVYAEFRGVLLSS